MPRPTRFRAFRLCAGFSDVRLSCSAILDLHQVSNLSKHACEDGPVVVLGGLSDLAEAERSQSPAMPLGLPDLATNLRHANFGHLLHLVAQSH
jgi:hypothetical protein